MQKVRNLLQKWGKIVGIILFLIVVFVVGNSTGQVPKVQVLSANTHIIPTPTSTPLPTSTPVTIINNIILPTQSPVVALPTPTSSPIVIVVTPAPTVEPTVAATPTPTIQSPASPAPTLTPIAQTVEVDVDYAGARHEDTYTISITPGESAWQAVQTAVGITNLQYTDYGGSLGTFITGFNTVSAAPNQYFDFQVNGTSSNVGVSSYTVADHDVLKFVLTSF